MNQNTAQQHQAHPTNDAQDTRPLTDAERARAKDHAATVLRPFDDEAATVDLIAGVTGREPGDVRTMLAGELADPGVTVERDMRARGVAFHEWSDALEAFYSETDAFLFELAVWNSNLHKRRMRRWIARHLARGGVSKRVLMMGDGIGADSAHLSLCGHRVTFFELPGLSFEAARRVIDLNGTRAELIDDAGALDKAADGDGYDAVISLDVLEHVPDPAHELGRLRGMLAPGGSLYVHAPFYLIHDKAATHLRTSRRFAGDPGLFRAAALEPVDGTSFWKPIVLRRSAEAARPPARVRRRLALSGLALALGRWTPLPAWAALRARRSGSEWFGAQRSRL